jgi:Cft2 family RNA processing exonuclease
VVELECIPYAVGHADEGVSLLVRVGPYRILLDCGVKDIAAFDELAQRSADFEVCLYSDLPADLVLCSHAHDDHARGLLALHQAFPKLPIYASEVTTQLLPLNWPEVAPSDIPLFCHALPWRTPIEFGDGLSVELFPAGHLPGAAAFLITYTPPPQRGQSTPRAQTLLYTGDFFLSNARLVEGLPLADMRGLAPDVLIVEGSFGTARHPHRRQQENQLAEQISQALKQGISVVLPVPILGLGQELLMLLRSHHYFTGQNLDIWVDSAIAAACDAYLSILPHLPATVRNFAQHQPLFWDQRVRPRVQRLHPQQPPPVGTSPCIVLTDEHVDLKQYCDAAASPLLLLLPRQMSPAVQAGVPASDRLRQVVEQFSPQLQSGQLQVDTYLLAEHSDGPGTTQLIHNLRPQHVVFVHGSAAYLDDLTGLDELSNRYHLHCPAAGTRVELPIGETIIQTPTPKPGTNYEGEVAELGTVISITLPAEITADPRWQNFADTGLVEATWHGEELVLRGLSVRELLMGQISPTVSDLECCASCQHYRGQHCWNQSSSLFGFKVSPEGYCPAYTALSTMQQSTPPFADQA